MLIEIECYRRPVGLHIRTMSLYMLALMVQSVRSRDMYSGSYSSCTQCICTPRLRVCANNGKLGGYCATINMFCGVSSLTVCGSACVVCVTLSLAVWQH